MSVSLRSPAAGTLAAPAQDRGAYRWYVLGVLFLVTLFNVTDRYILHTLLQPIKEEFHASDTAMGLLIGFNFALVHILASMVIARFADRGVRRTIIAAGLFVWSGLTALSGLATSYLGLALARMGVATAEGAGSSPAHSMLCDYFPIERRTTVLTIFGLGGIAGTAVGAGVIGPIAGAWGWRHAFFVLGIPGALLSLLVWWSVREPVRGAFDGADAPAVSHHTRDVLRALLGQRSFVYMVGAASLYAFASQGAGPFYVAYLMRSHGMTIGLAGFSFMWVGPLASGVGALLGGLLTDRLARRDARWYAWIPAASALAGLPFMVAFVLWPAGGSFEIFGKALPTALLMMLCASLLGAAWLGPILATTQTLARPNMRAFASALTTGSYNLIGMGLGPLVVGLVSDGLAQRFGAESLRYGLLAVSFAHLGGAAVSLLGARTLRSDLAAARRA
ncbi:MAG TPA: MFS transporter [Myxococcota bacterium]|nr:MFS transporter [Myxococcota bacterium]